MLLLMLLTIFVCISFVVDAITTRVIVYCACPCPVFFFSTPFIGSYNGEHHVGGIEGSTNSLRSLVYLTVPTKY